MKKRTPYIFLILIIYTQLSFSQNVKPYKGNAYYMYHPGTEMYSFYEKDGKRIKQGKYSFIGKLSGYADGTSNNTSLKITGYFKNGKAENLWTLIWRGTQNGATMNSTLKIQYKNGLPNGKSNYDFIVKKGNRSGYAKEMCTFKNGKFTGDYLYKKGITGYTDPEYVLKGKFSSDGYMIGEWVRIDNSQNSYWQKVTKKTEDENEFNDFKNGIKINNNKELIYLKDKDYINLHYGSMSNSEYDAFKKGFSVYAEEMNPIFEITEFGTYIYITRKPETADLRKMNELKTKFKSENDTIAVKKINFCINIKKAKQILNNNKNKTVVGYEEAKSYLKKALQFYPDDQYEKDMGRLIEGKIDSVISTDFNLISSEIDKKNYKNAISRLEKIEKLSNEYTNLQVKKKIQTAENRLKESLKNQLNKFLNEADKYLKEIKSSFAEQAINEANTFLTSYNKYLENDIRIVQLRNKLKVVKVLEEKYNQIAKEIIDLELSFKAPPENEPNLSNKRIKKVKKAYGETYVNFNETKTIKSISNLLFPFNDIKLNYLYFQDNQKKQAVIWDENKIFIYNSFRELILNTKNTIHSETDINKNIKNADLLLSFLKKYSLILSKEDKAVKKINKEFETIKGPDKIKLFLNKI